MGSSQRAALQSRTAPLSFAALGFGGLYVLKVIRRTAVAAVLFVVPSIPGADAQAPLNANGRPLCFRGFDACFSHCLQNGAATGMTPQSACSNKCTRICAMADHPELFDKSMGAFHREAFHHETLH